MDYQTQYPGIQSARRCGGSMPIFADTTVSYHRLLEAMHYGLTAGGKRCVRCWCSRSAQPAVGMCARRCQLRVRSRWCILIRSSTTICRAWITMICAAAADEPRGLWRVHGDAGGRRPAGGGIPTILSTELPADVRAECARLLAEAAGENGICGGQQLDMEGEGNKADAGDAAPTAKSALFSCWAAA